MKSLILIRHGRAEPRPKYRRDAERPLTSAGAHEVCLVARGLAHLAAPSLILSSPLVRARQTAELLAQAFDPAPRIITIDELGGMDDMPALLAHVARHHDQVIALVGHEPGMGELTSYLLTGRRSAAVDFKKAGACRIDLPDKLAGGAGTLVWLIPPRAMRLIGKA